MKKWMIACFAVIALAGCSSNNTSGLRIDSSSQQVLYGDSELDSRLSIKDISTKNLNGNTRGVVQVESKYKGDQQLQYRFYWYDEDGIEVNAKQGAWRQFILRGSESISLSEVSVNPNAKEFRIQIRPQDQ
ncbi:MULTISPECIES: YcfL family protein [Vibrio]|uniref:DUF1425 domain-containing protein n=1 Tax=Vibrio algicola TaxID=2662262 RepID=A0A5Q0TE41_9VIBR|nr:MULTISPECIES: YcfL family protein [Vibrio]MBD1576805.1 DUF1425 domain-containing protein [Vibrio sp. S11_S32]